MITVGGELTLDMLDLRFNPMSGEAALRERVEALLKRHRLDFTLEWDCSGSPYYTGPGALLDAVTGAVRDVTGTTPVPDTGGGTSDGRFVATTGAQVVELGPCNASIHKIDEHVRVEDLGRLVAIHRAILERLLA